MSPSRPLLSSDRNMHWLVTETRVVQRQEARKWGGGKFLGIKICLNGCCLLKDEMKQQGSGGSTRASERPHEFPQ